MSTRHVGVNARLAAVPAQPGTTPAEVVARIEAGLSEATRRIPVEDLDAFIRRLPAQGIGA
ncbi:MAG: hypothetical protein ACRDZQ_06375 [Acidimicrobiales bacterium]